jgi:hypothetical protein
MEKSLKTFQELVVKGEREDLSSFFEDLTRDLERKGWVRDTNREKEYAKYTLGYDGIFIKTPRLEGDLKAEITLISEKSQNEYKTVNIIPLNKPSLDYDEYNEILKIFYDSFIKDRYKKHNLKVEISEPKTSLDKHLSHDSMKLLEAFSHLANKSTGSAYPSDHKRWNEFIINVFKGGEELPTDIFRRWLIEVDGWSEDVAEELVIEFDHSIDLLRQYNKENAGELITVK